MTGWMGSSSRRAASAGHSARRKSPNLRTVLGIDARNVSSLREHLADAGRWETNLLGHLRGRKNLRCDRQVIDGVTTAFTLVV
jgi:hypothetical protein